MTVALEGKEIVAVYLLLKRGEPALDATLAAVRSRLERALYSVLSIEELENLERIYATKGNLLAGL